MADLDAEVTFYGWWVDCLSCGRHGVNAWDVGGVQVLECTECLATWVPIWDVKR